MMIIKRVANKGIKVTEASNGLGSPYVESDRGIPVTFVASGGIPLRAGGGVLGLHNVNSGNVAQIKAAFASVAAGSARGKIAFAGSSSFARPLKGTSLPARVAALLAARGVNAEGLQSLFATANYMGQPYTDYDTRVVGLGNWTAGSLNGPGGPLFTHLVASNANDFAFTPQLAHDRTQLKFSAFTPAATINVRSDGVLKAGSQVLAGTNGNLITIDITDTLGVHTVSMAKTTATAARIQLCSIESWNSAVPALSIFGMGWGSSRATDWAETTYQTSPKNLLATYDLDGMLMLNGLNEMIAGVSVGDYATAHDGNVVSAKAYCDPIVCIPQWADPAKTQSLDTQALYRNQAIEIALDNDCPYIDLGELQGGSFEAANDAGLMDSSGYHFTDLGTAVMAAGISAALLSL